MKKKIMRPGIVLGLAITGVLVTISTTFAADTPLPANRYDLPRNYHSEISAAEAYLKAIDHDTRWGRDHRHEYRRPVILDVRSIPEYVAGHPEGAINVPFPFIYQPCDERAPDGACIGGGERIPQTEEGLVNAVLASIPDKDTPIYTLCRTGHRSVLAANVLTAAGYTHVHNIWQGFVGKPKVDANGNTPLDLNHDGVITDADNDGWRYYQGLPYTTRLRPRLLYQPYITYYY